MQRHDVFYSDRLTVTEHLIRRTGAEKVLEIGAGDHSFDNACKRQTSLWIKADFAPPCDVVCDFNTPDLTVPFSDGYFDLVICTEVLEHLLWPQLVLTEALRVLRPGGKILVSVPNVNSLSYRLAWLLGRIPSCAASGNLPPELGSTAYCQAGGRLVGGHVVDFNLRKTVALVAWAGFTVETLKGSGIIWHRQVLPNWLVPVSLASNIICLAGKPL